jgi:uncharacterized protein YjbJ (UPF0337 family)
MGIPNRDEIKGKVNRAKGSVKEKIGRATDDPGMEERGRQDQSKGNAQETVGKARRKVGEAISDLGKKVGR